MVMKRALSAEDVKSKKEKPRRYAGRQSLQKTVFPKKLKARQTSPASRQHITELLHDAYDASYMRNVPPRKPSRETSKPSTSTASQPVSDVVPCKTSPLPSLSIFDNLGPEWADVQGRLERVARESEMEGGYIAPNMNCYGLLRGGCSSFNTTMWLSLQAFFANRPMTMSHSQRSITAQYSQIVRLRDEKRHVFTDILNFKLDLIPEPADVDWLQGVYHPVIISNIRVAICRVSALLRRFEEFIQLYPTLKDMKCGEKEYFTDEVSTRVKLLYIWENTVNDLFARIGEVRNYFDVITDSRKRSSQISSVNGAGTPQSPKTPVVDVVWPQCVNPSGSGDGSPASPVEDVAVSSESLIQSISNMYANVVGRSLRLRGMIIVLDRIRNICNRSLEKAAMSLQVPRLYAQAAAASTSFSSFVNGLSTQEKKELLELTVYHPVFRAMGLPSFYHQFAFLVRIPVDLVLHWLRMRSEKVHWNRWDLLTLNTLIEDSDDCLSAAIGVKERYMEFIVRTTANSLQQQNYLEDFDAKLDVVFQNYLSYIRHWAQTATSDSDVDVEWCEKVVSKLRDQWGRAKVYSTSVTRGESAAAQLFCNVGKDLLNQIVQTYITEKMDSAGQDLFEDAIDDEQTLVPVDEEEEEDETYSSSVFVLCREFREMIRHLRERSLKCMMFVKLLSTDLEICSKYGMDGRHTANDVIVTLTEKSHVLLNFTNYPDCPFVVLCTREVVNRPEYIDTLLNITCASLESECVVPPNPNASSPCPPYLVVLTASQVDPHLIAHSLKSSMVLSLKTKTTLEHYVTVVDNDLFLIAENRRQLDQSRSCFERSCRTFFESRRLRLKDDFCSCNDEIASEMSDLKEVCFVTSDEMWNCPMELETLFLNGKKLDDLTPKEASTLKATLTQAFNVAFEFDREMTRIVSVPKHPEFAEKAVDNLAVWTDFVIHSSRSGYRFTSRGAAIPLNCLQLLASEKVAAYLSADARKKLLTNMNLVLDIIHTPTVRPSCSANSFTRVAEENGESLPPLNLTGILSPKKVTVSERIQQQVDFLEQDRQDYLEAEHKVGKVVESDHHRAESLFLRPTRAPFEWQRLENKILGTGSFGICHLVMNLNDDCLMAMKQIKVCRENNDNLKALIDEVDILRSLDHPNLVKYYGVEVHKDELLIFMEYCSEGTLTRVCREGLELNCVRRYTHFLLQAVDYLHRRKIVHRDIKPANIFLTQKDILKLGDFGCSFRMREPSTRRGEMVTYVGTTNYQAPELQTNTVAGNGTCHDDTSDYGSSTATGYGRAVDIWSTGCVVLEMLTGKRPYYHLTHELQVIYQLGSGIPPRFTPEITNNSMTYVFLKKCFTVDPTERPTAAELLQDPFANIDATVLENLPA